MLIIGRGVTEIKCLWKIVFINCTVSISKFLRLLFNSNLICATVLGKYLYLAACFSYHCSSKLNSKSEINNYYFYYYFWFFLTGNSAFETADSIMGATNLIHMFARLYFKAKTSYTITYVQYNMYNTIQYNMYNIVNWTFHFEKKDINTVFKWILRYQMNTLIFKKKLKLCSFFVWLVAMFSLKLI